MDIAVFNQEAYFKVMETQKKNEAFTSRTPFITKTKRVVRFGTVTVHENPIIIGCNPAVSSGVPITIAWNSVSSRQLPINDFEYDRRKERVSNPMFLKQTKSERWNVLQNLGFRCDEMRLAEQEASEIRCLRSLTTISEKSDDTESLSRLQALLQESRARREHILKQKRRQSLRLRRLFAHKLK
jgi:hypothetical protein